MCGGDQVYRTVCPPHEWRTVLRKRRFYKDAEGYVSIPACTGCYFRVRNLMEASRELTHYDLETRTQFEREIDQLLEELDLGMLITDEGDEPL